MGLKLHTTYEYNWDEALKKSPENQWPLAPADLIKEGKVTSWKYKKENQRFRSFITKLMIPEMDAARREPEFGNGPWRIEVWGAGLLRDLLWIVHSVKLDMIATIVDKSIVACELATRFAKKHDIKEKVYVVHNEVEEAQEASIIGNGQSMVIYAGQFIQNQSKEKMEGLMKGVGSFLKHQHSDCPRRRFYMLHARGEDNPPEKVVWRNTTPYLDVEWEQPLFEELGEDLEIAVLGVHKYFNHQVYTLYRITRKELRR